MRHRGAGRETKYLGPRVMSALQVWLWLLLFIFQNNFRISRTAEPGYLDFDNLPDTNFSCAGKVIGGYYADLETDCQMFHVCTIGQLEEPMDIKFLCLNGTVFDQETRVCERVDEVDCSRSEHFYSLNLELYGNTAPPIIKADPPKTPDTEEEVVGDDEEYDLEEVYDEPSTTIKSTTTVTTATSTTAKPTTKTPTRPTFFTTLKPTYYPTTVQSSYNSHDSSSDPEDETYELIDDNEDSSPPSKNSTGPNFPHYNSDSQLQRPSPNSEGQSNKFPDFDLTSTGGGDGGLPTDNEDISHAYDPHELIYQRNNLGRKTPAVSFQQQSFSSEGRKSHVTVTTHTLGAAYNADASKPLNKNNENAQLSRTYLSSSTPNSNTKSFKDKSPSFDKYPAFDSPKRAPLIPTPVAQGQIPTGHPGISAPKHQHPDEPLYFSFRKPALTPQGFRSNSHVNLNSKPNVKSPAKPFQSYQPSERHEVSIESEYEFEKLTPFIHQDFSQYHYEHKRSQEAVKYEPSNADKGVETTTVTSTPYYNTWATRNNNYTKSLPRVIVTASASVSDSNGKKLNYTVGSIVHAVKPLGPTNYDDYKESDVLLDPFFLDVPKIKKPRGKRSSKGKRIRRRNIVGTDARGYFPKFDYGTTTKPSTDLDIPIQLEQFSTMPSQSIVSTEHISGDENTYSSQSPTNKMTDVKVETRPSHWVPPDYVNDNYEPFTYSETPPHIEENKLHNGNGSFKRLTNIRIINANKNAEPLYVSTVPRSMAAPRSSFRATLINKNMPYASHTRRPKSLVVTTENGVAKTTLDVANLETTTISFIESVMNRNVSTEESNNYKIRSVDLVTISDKSSNSVKFSCNGKKYFKFYPDKTDCRTFHFCSPGLGPHQVLHIAFICDSGSFFNHNSVRCIPDKPTDCQLYSVL